MTTVKELQSKTANLPPLDPNVKLPAAIRAAAARSDALHQEAYNEPAPTPVEPEVKADPEKPEATSGQETREAPDAASAPATQKPANPEEWERNFNSMKGRFEKAQTTISGLNSRIADLERLLSDANKAKPVQQPTPDLQFKGVSAEERETYGEDFLDVSARAAAERFNPQISELKAELSRLQGQLGNVATQTHRSTREQLFSYLDGTLSNWREINRNPDFIAWANLQDPLSGVIRLQMMTEAFEQGDGPRVLRFFNGFLTDEATTAPAMDTKQDKANKGKVPLETFAAPGRAKAPAATPAPGEKETISHAQIAQFYADVNKGKYRGNDAEKNRLEQMIFDAQQDGRIV